MSQPPFEPPPLNYATGSPYRSAPTLVTLAVIFNYVVAGLDMLFGLAGIGYGVFFFVLMSSTTTTMTARGAAVTMPSPPRWLPMIYFLPAIPSAVVATVKIIGATKLRRRGKNAWGW